MTFNVLRNKLKKKANTLNDNLKVVLDEIKRGVYKRPIDVFDTMFVLADQFSDDVEGLLVETEKTHLLIPRKKLEDKCDWIESLKGTNLSPLYDEQYKVLRFVKELLEGEEK